MFISNILLVCMSGWISVGAHPLHLSRCEIDYRPDRQVLEIALRAFTDDFEDAIERRHDAELRLGTEQEHVDADAMILVYLQERVRISQSTEPLSFQWVGKEIGVEASWVYLEVVNVGPTREFEVTYEVLMEFFDDQRNMLTFRCEDQKESLLFRADERLHTVSFVK